MRIVGGLLILFLFLNTSASEVEIDVLGLFKNAALLNIEGNRILLKVGDRSPQGVELVSATSKEAVIRLSGETITLNLSSRIAAEFDAAETVSVSIMLNDAGQYRTTGSINGRPVTFLVDTGANIVAINSRMAATLGVDASKGRIMRATTASGVIESRQVTLNSVKVGGIQAKNVQAAVIQGDFPQEILLGMSFLRNVEIRENAGVMQLTAKF